MGARRRRGLADLIGEVGAAPQEDPKEDEGRIRDPGAAGGMGPGARTEEAQGHRQGGEGEVPASPTERSPYAGAGAREAPALPKYLSLERKEARLRSDQVDSLSALARRVNRQKASPGGERITENTLIRVAVDWILGQEAYIRGSSEEEIRRGLGVPDPRVERGV